MDATHNAFCIFQLFANAFHICVNSTVGKAHGFQAFSTNFVKLEGVNQKANNFVRRNLEQFFRRSKFRNKRNVCNFNAFMRKVHRKRSFRSTGYANDYHVSFQQAHGVLTIVVLNCELYSFHAFEVFVVKRVNQTSLVLRQHTSRLFYRFNHRTKHVNNLHIHSHSLICNMFAQFRGNYGMTNNSFMLSCFCNNFINLRFILYIRNAGNIKFFFTKLANGSLYYGFSSFADGIGNRVNNRISFHCYNALLYLLPNLPADV